jgi:phage terminase large subunit-like protein
VSDPYRTQDPVRWAPQDGPQTTFASSKADIALFGGAAGGGKSFALLYEAGKWAHVPGYRGILFRRTSPELVGGGGLWDESQEMYRAFGGRPRGAPTLDWVFEAGARIEFRHLHREDDVYAHQGRQYAFVGFDEVTHFTARQFWYVVSRLRSTCGVRPYVRATCNPDPESFVAKMIAWWIGPDGYPIAERSGVLRWLVRDGDELHWYASKDEARAAHGEGCEPLSFTFVAAALADNAILLEKDPTYRSKLLSLGRVERERLLGDEKRGGNWHVTPSAGLVFPRRCFRRSPTPPSPIVRTVRAWDKGSTPKSDTNPNPDWTRGVRVSICEGGELWIDDLVSLRERPALVFGEMRATAERDGVSTAIGLWQDAAGAGKVDVETTQAVLAGFPVEVVSAAEGIIRGHGGRGRAKWAHAKAWSPLVERGLVWVLEAEWTDLALTECDEFPDARHDDIVDAISLAWQLLAMGAGAVPMVGGHERQTAGLRRQRWT